MGGIRLDFPGMEPGKSTTGLNLIAMFDDTGGYI